jgi:hypothetical protein
MQCGHGLFCGVFLGGLAARYSVVRATVSGGQLICELPDMDGSEPSGLEPPVMGNELMEMVDGEGGV